MTAEPARRAVGSIREGFAYRDRGTGGGGGLGQFFTKHRPPAAG